jgi:hypothetical protein
MSLFGRWQGKVSWAEKMRRLNHGAMDQEEWMAPDDVITKVKDDFIEAMDWLSETQSMTMLDRWSKSANYFSGEYLKNYKALNQMHLFKVPFKHLSILRCVHSPTVRHFSQDGETCFIIDHQTETRMALYDANTGERINTQHLDEACVVYQMIYNKFSKRWRVNRYIQQLPVGWASRSKSDVIQLHLSPLPPKGRDN